jgi:hypothetical protein
MAEGGQVRIPTRKEKGKSDTHALSMIKKGVSQNKERQQERGALTHYRLGAQSKGPIRTRRDSKGERNTHELSGTERLVKTQKGSETASGTHSLTNTVRGERWTWQGSE